MKLFLSILFSIFFILFLGGLFVAIFLIFIPFLKKKNINVNDPLFSEYDMVHYDATLFEHDTNSSKRAVVLCSHEKKFDDVRLDYEGVKDCSLFSSLYDGEHECSWECRGFGNCISSCPKHAIIIKNKTAVVTNTCTGCGLCLDSCPLHLIQLIDFNTKECVLCSCEDDCKTSCSMKGKNNLLKNEESKDFHFWQKCYRMLNRK